MNYLQACLMAVVVSSSTLVGILHGADLPSWTWAGETMGSRYRVTVANPPDSPTLHSNLIQEVDERLKQINLQMSHYLPESELSRFNKAPAGSPVTISDELELVTRFALEMSRRSNGAFDPTLSPLINLWGFGEAGPALAPPSDAAIQKARQIVGWQKIQFTPQHQLQKQMDGVSLNLSALAKGYAVDEMVRLLQKHGLTNVYASIAGEIRVSGHSPRGGPWRIGISAPLELWRENDPLAAAVELQDMAISTSGDYQKFYYDAEGRRLAHILDPRTGHPVQHDLGSVTVVAPEGIVADALSTTLFVLGAKDGLNFIESWTNAAALFILREKDTQSFRLIPSSRFSKLTGWRAP
mgnify:CR=1 FL=1